jgi:hypothetical protein
MAMIKCKECGYRISDKASTCPNCGMPQKKKKGSGCSLILSILIVLFLFSALFTEPSPTNNGISKEPQNVMTSYGLSKSDLAWHAVNSYGWDCHKVVSKGHQGQQLKRDGYYIITCSSGKKLRVYPRSGQHPKITNYNGTYSSY